MYKEVILFALIAPSIPLQAVDWKGINWWKMNPTYWLTQTHPSLPVNLSNHAFGVASSNGVTITENAVKVGDSFVKGAEELGASFATGAEKLGDKFVQATEPLKDPKVIEATSHAVSHGFMYGLASGIPTAVKDGALYIKDTAVEHPIIATGIVATAMGTAVYHKFRPLTEEEQQLQQIEKDKRLAMIRKAASIARADEYADDYRRCLSRHAHDKGSCEDRIRRCHSPAARLAAEHRKLADEITESYRAYNR